MQRATSKNGRMSSSCHKRKCRVIEFDCPKCGEPMEVKNKMAGENVRCVGCDRLVRVPEDDEDDDLPPRRSPKSDDGLSSQEWLLYGLGFLLFPAANVLVSSILYCVWRADRPKRATQINMLGWAVLAIHVALFCLIMIVMIAAGIAGRR
jgi:hypothetical protein